MACADCVVEIGGPGTIAMSLNALGVGGHISLIGASLSLSGTGLDPLLLTGRGISVGAISVGSRAEGGGRGPTKFGVDTAAISQLTHLLVPIRRLAVVVGAKPVSKVIRADRAAKPGPSNRGN